VRLNQKVADIFSKTAQLLEITGANSFRVRAYENAARRIESMQEDLADFLCSDTLTSIEGIGKDLADKIKQIYETGTIDAYEQLKAKVPAGLIEILKLQGIGPKKVKALYETLKIDSIDKLEKAAKSGRLSELPGFGKKTQENILRSIEFYRQSSTRHLLGEAIEVAMAFKDYLREALGKRIKKIEVAGSVRRFKETVHDIDILVVARSGKEVMQACRDFPLNEAVLGIGDKKASFIANGIQIDVRVFPENEFGSALLYFTGSKEHNIKLRQLCQEKNWKLNEYGLFDADGKVIASKTEEEIYDKLSMQFIAPEIREGLDEINLALKNALPTFIDMEDIKGDLHMHTFYSDGVNSIEEMAHAGINLGYSYIAITDHSASLKVANGLDRKRLLQQIDEVRRVNEKLKPFRVFTGIEADILPDGSLDVEEDLIPYLDVVIGAVHTAFKMTKSEMTKRILKAIKTGHINILAHPKGRLLNVRDAYDVDLDEVFRAAIDYNVAMEINSSPKRLDLNAEDARRAVKAGLKIAIDTDSHSSAQLKQVLFGVHTARRGWIEAKDVINCMDLTDLEEFLKRR